MCSDAGGGRGAISIPTYFSVWISPLTVNQGRTKGLLPPPPRNNPVKLKFSDERFSFNFADSVIKKKELNELE